MIVVKIELWSGPGAANRRELGAMVIDNQDVRDGGNRGDYRVRVARKGGGIPGALLRPLREGEVKDYPRLSYNVWRLVVRALLSAFPEERA